jgi:hypothetical protein
VKSYKVLADKQKPASTTAVSLTKLALDYVRLAVRVSARTATKQKPARIAPPFTTATLRDGAAHWTFAPSQVCAPYLSLGRSK